MINQGRYSFLSVPMVDGMLEGGVPILIEGQVIGAVGVSGVKSSADAEIARTGIAALGACSLPGASVAASGAGSGFRRPDTRPRATTCLVVGLVRLRPFGLPQHTTQSTDSR